jgi:lipopolysaccharide/colanic/teichoic acid biosynthesis glycosyltransferase
MIKRLFDIVASLLAILVFSPLLIPVMIVLRCTGEGEVFYPQERIGRGGKAFQILKFATMLKNSPNMTGGDITAKNDPRVLPVGRVLRKAKINELPQLLNVFKGDMSVIGPRPFTPGIARMFPASHWQTVAALRPGLSGVGSLVFRDEEALLGQGADRARIYQDVIVPAKMELEAWYAANQSLGLDLKLIFLTVVAVIQPGFDVYAALRTLPPPSRGLTELRARTA